MKWIWAGRIRLRFAASSISPTGPSPGMGYDSGLTVRKWNLPSPSARSWPRPHAVEPVFVSLPDCEVRARYWLPAHRAHPSLDETRLAGGAVGEVVAALEEGRVLDEKGAEHRGLGGAGWLLVVDPDDQHRRAQGIGEQELLALVVGHVAGPGEEV